MTDRDKTKESSEVIESAWHALLALSRETLQFRFDYSLDIIPEAGPKESLDYYLYSERLSWSAMRMDPTGVPRAWERLTGTVYRPSYIAWWGLVNLSHFLRHHDDPSRVAFLKQVNWLEANSVVRTDGSVVWPNNFDYLEAKTILKAPWISAYDQGLVISALVRGYRFTKRPRLLELLQGASRIFELDVHEGGVRKLLSRGALYIERPGYPIPGILDGFMSSLLGLYDLFVETGDLAVGNLFTDGIEGLKEMLPTWDYRKRWSWYGAREYLCPPAYHSLNRVLLQVLGRLSAEPLLAEYAEAWKTDHLSALGRAEIFLGFLITKNASRVRNRTWLQSNGKVRALATLVPINQQLPSHPLGRRNSSPSRLPRNTNPSDTASESEKAKGGGNSSLPEAGAEPTTETPGVIPFTCLECECELKPTGDQCRCPDCGASWPFVRGIPSFFATEERFSSCASISQQIERCLSKHPVLGNWNLEFVGRHFARHSEVLEYKRRDQPQAPTLMIKHRMPTLSRAASERHVTHEFDIIQDLRSRADASFQATIPKPVALLPEVGAAVYERVPGVSLATILKVNANCFIGPIRHQKMCRIAGWSGQWLHTLHELNRSRFAPHDAKNYLAKLAFWLRRAIKAGLDRKTASTVWGTAARSATRVNAGIVCYTVMHGDFIPQNIFVNPGGVAVIDFADSRKREVVYEDLGYSVAFWRLLAGRWVYSRSLLTAMATAFLDGYGDSLNPELLNLYVTKAIVIIFATQFVPQYPSRKDARRLHRIEADLVKQTQVVAES